MCNEIVGSKAGGCHHACSYDKLHTKQAAMDFKIETSRNWERKTSKKNTLRKVLALRFDGLDMATAEFCAKKLRRFLTENKKGYDEEVARSCVR